MTKKKKKEDKLPLGRPNAIDEFVVKKLIDGFKMGFNDSECCAYAEISRPTYYAYLKQNPDFINKVNDAKENPFLMAKTTVYNALVEDHKTAMWYLEKRRKDEFGETHKVDLISSDGSMSPNSELKELDTDSLRKIRDILAMSKKKDESPS